MKSSGKYDAIVVLGGGSKRNGELQIDSKIRIRKAVKLFERGEADKMILSGGYTKPMVSEAAKMMEYAIKISDHVQKKDVVLEEKSKDTIGNAYFTKQVMKRKGWRSVIVVTSSFHVPRSELAFRKTFGKKYKINFVGSVYSPKLFLVYVLIGIERKFYEMTKLFFKKVKSGDDKAVAKKLKEYHPEYMPKSRIEKFKKLRDLPEKEAVNKIAQMMDVNEEFVWKNRRFVKFMLKKNGLL